MSLNEITDAGRSPNDRVELPTGLLVGDQLYKDCEIRELTGYEEDILMSKKLKTGQKTQKLLENCVLSIGSITQKDPKWTTYIKELVDSDRMFLMIQIRAASLGPIFSFKVECPSCEKEMKEEIRLDSFKVTGMKDPMMRSWENTMPKSGKKYKARVRNGFDDDKVISFNNDDVLSLVLVQRLIEIDGKFPVSLEMVKSLAILDRKFIREDLRSKEGSYDDDIQTQCQHCDFEFETGINFGDSNFFFPTEMAQS